MPSRWSRSRIGTRTWRNLNKIDEKIAEENKQRTERLDEIVERLHSGFINDEHFDSDPDKYIQFMNEYIR